MNLSRELLLASGGPRLAGDLPRAAGVGDDPAVELLELHASAAADARLAELLATPPAERPAVLVVGGAVPPEWVRAADLTLPGDFSERELATACRLLREVVRLRRQLARERASSGAWREIAQCDPLTGLLNRRGLEEALERLALGAADTPAVRTLCAAVLDLDDLKRINDRAGHAAGDAALRELGASVARTVRKQDLAARVGGDEFVLLLAGAPLERAGAIVERIRQAACGAGWTVSAGWAAAENDGSPQFTSRLWEQADRQLLRAKSAGKNRTAG